ncbi:hypothetical protein BN11_40001 [Nostocoides australiense Ben110]|uniref:AAA+ ATPase domain-containing protein n=1 Tax=Nostocoides australiense Ben110 TaxID=1193182 RepID=W6JYE9_9MICO|nr:hypothetical protein BN11_40001 [Tetrasphaera australiensis Ben110]
MRITAPAATRLMPQNIDDWPALVTADNPRPQPAANVTDALRRQVDAYNQRIGTISTRDTRTVREAIHRAHFENDHSAYGSATCVILSGAPMSGKTHAALTCAFSETRDIWGRLGRAPDDPKFDRSIPWIYVEVPKQARELSLLKAIWTFIGLPPLPPRATASDYLQALRKLAPAIGLRGVIIDDSHGIGERQNEHSRLLADILKSIITGLPATIVLTGTGFDESGVLRGSAGDQVRLRSSRWIDVGKWPPPSPNTVGDWELFGRSLSERLVLPRSTATVRLTTRGAVRALLEGSRGRPGLAVEWAKRAASYAVWHDTDLDVTALEATHAGPPSGGAS